MADNDKLHEFDVEVFASGKWNGDTYTDDDLTAMVKAFSALGDTVKPPVKLGHNEKQMKDILGDGQPALGWVKSLKQMGSKLIATITQVPDLVYQAIKAGRYKRVSSEIYWNYKQDGKVFSRVLAGVALLGADIPAVSTLADLEAYLKQSMLDASFDRMTAYTFEADETGTIKDYASKGDDMAEDLKKYQDEIDALKSANTDLSEKLKSYDNLITESKTYKAQLDAIRKERSDEKMEAKKKVFTDLCNSMVEAGKMPPAVRDTLCNFDKLTYSDDGGFSISVDTLSDAFKTLSLILDKTEKGEEKKNNLPEGATAFEEVNIKAKAYATEKKVGYADAVKAVLTEDTELADRYLSSSAKSDEE
jgi:hypothetical protein